MRAGPDTGAVQVAKVIRGKPTADGTVLTPLEEIQS